MKSRADFDAAVRAAFGPARRLADIRRLAGGSKKGVYRLAFDDGSSAVGYIWDQGENFWPASSKSQAYDQRTDPFSAASGAGLFEAAHTLLTGLGVRVPELHLLDTTGAFGDFDLALVEDLPGGTLEDKLRVDAPGADEVIGRLAAALELMYGCRGEGFGKVGFPLVSGSSEQVVFDREWEHAFLELRFGGHYRSLGRDDLDQHRLRLYRLALSLSLAAVPMRLANSDYPERDFMIEIAEYNAERVLSSLTL